MNTPRNTPRCKYEVFAVISGILVTIALTPLSITLMQQAFAANSTSYPPGSPCANKTNSTAGNSSNNSTAGNSTISTTAKSSHIPKVDLTRGPQDKFLTNAIQPCSHKDNPSQQHIS